MDVGLSPWDFVLDGDPVPPPQKGVEHPKFWAHVYCFLSYSCEEAMPVPRYTIGVLVNIEFRLNILRNPVTLLTLFVLKIDLYLTVTITPFKTS